MSGVGVPRFGSRFGVSINIVIRGFMFWVRVFEGAGFRVWVFRDSGFVFICSRFRVSSCGFGVSDAVYAVQGFGYEFHGPGFGVWCFEVRGCRSGVPGSGFRDAGFRGLGFQVRGFWGLVFRVRGFAVRSIGCGIRGLCS